MGIFSCIASIVRLQSIYRFTLSTEPFRDGIPVNLWSIIEIAVAMICASLPALKQMLTNISRHLSQLTGSLTGTRSQQTSSNKPGSEQKPPAPHTPESNRRDAYNVAGLTDMSSFASSTNGTQIDRDEDRAVQAPAEKSSEHILAPTNVHEQVETKQ